MSLSTSTLLPLSGGVTSTIHVKTIFKHVAVISAAACIFFAATAAFGEKKVFEKEYIYQASEMDSKITSRAIALEQGWIIYYIKRCTLVVTNRRILHFPADKIFPHAIRSPKSVTPTYRDKTIGIHEQVYR